MDIVVIAEFCGDFSQTDNGRFLFLANMLSEDNDVEIITSSFFHAIKEHRIEAQNEWNFNITFIDEPGYSQNVSIKRIISHQIWGKNLLKYLKSRRKPDVIYCAVPSLSGPSRVAKYCEKKHIRFVIDVQDLWPEAFQMAFNIPLVSTFVFAPFKKSANSIYRRADAICAVSDTYCKRALSVNDRVEKFTTVYLGTELATFDRYASSNPILEKKKGEIWLAYCGTLGSSYDIKCVIDALAIIKDNRIKLIVIGDGPKKDEFKKHAIEKGVNAIFVGRLQYDSMCSLLNTCDITINPITHLAAQSIINKHADYAASGLPIVSNQESDEYRNLINEYHMGFNCINNDCNDMASKIKILVENDELRKEMGANARRCAEEKFDRAITYKLLEKTVLTSGGGYCGLVKMSGEIWLGYAGTLGTSYDLPLVFDAMRRLKNRDLKLIIMGDGPLINDFKKQSQDLNVVFMGRLKYSNMCGVLNACDIVVNPIVSSSVASIINKHADYAASGNPVINTQKSDEYRQLINKYHMGINCNSVHEVVGALQKLTKNYELRTQMGINSRKCAEECFHRRNTYNNIKSLIVG